MEFKKGDYVISIVDNQQSSAPRGTVYRVREDFPSGSNKEFVRVEKDAVGRPNGFSPETFLNLGSDKCVSKLEKIIYGI